MCRVAWSVALLRRRRPTGREDRRRCRGSRRAGHGPDRSLARRALARRTGRRHRRRAIRVGGRRSHGGAPGPVRRKSDVGRGPRDIAGLPRPRTGRVVAGNGRDRRRARQSPRQARTGPAGDARRPRSRGRGRPIRSPGRARPPPCVRRRRPAVARQGTPGGTEGRVRARRSRRPAPAARVPRQAARRPPGRRAHGRRPRVHPRRRHVGDRVRRAQRTGVVPGERAVGPRHRRANPLAARRLGQPARGPVERRRTAPARSRRATP